MNSRSVIILALFTQLCQNNCTFNKNIENDLDNCILIQTYNETKICEKTYSKKHCLTDYIQFKLSENAIKKCCEILDKNLDR